MSETLSFTDTATGSQSIEILLSETLSLTDTTTGIMSGEKTIPTEILALTDTITKAVEIQLSDTLSLTDTVSMAGTTSVLLSDTLSLTDTISKSADISMSETVSLSAVITIDGTTSIELSETLALADTITKEADIPVSETLSFTDSLSGVAEIVLSETLSFTDGTDGVRSGGLILSETLSLVDSVLVESAPFAPTLTAIPASGQIILSWNQPFNGNLPITDYQIQHSNNNGASWNTINDGVNTGLAFTVLPNYPGCPSEPCIQNGVEAKFRVRAINSMGNGAASVPVDVTPAVSTSKIQTVTLDNDITGMQGIYVQWTLDPSVGANIICDYLVYYATSAAGPWILYDDGY